MALLANIKNIPFRIVDIVLYPEDIGSLALPGLRFRPVTGNGCNFKIRVC